MNDITPNHAAEIMTTLESAYGPRQPIDYDSIGAAYLAGAKRDAAISYWESVCPSDLQQSDWQHPRLTPYRAPIAAILGHGCGAKGILATGPTGRGKTRAMWQLMRRLAVDEGNDVRCWHSTDFFSMLQSQINYGRDDAAGWVEAVARRKIVFIDDLGQEALTQARTDWAQGWFFRFLDIRVGEKLPLYVTTNMRGEDMAERSAKNNLRSDPLIRRLLDLCDVVKFENVRA
jgi:hypothetical protein